MSFLEVKKKKKWLESLTMRTTRSTPIKPTDIDIKSFFEEQTLFYTTTSSRTFFLRSRAHSDGKIMQIRQMNEEGLGRGRVVARKIHRVQQNFEEERDCS